MAPRPSSLASRHSTPLAQTPTRPRTSIPVDDFDEIAGDTIPCSPVAFLLDRAPAAVTQPTQILSPNLVTIGSSSPVHEIEVPASSPFPRESQPPRIGSRIAPAGTYFRPPPRPAPAAAPKRPAPEPINLISDDEDDAEPCRGDIHPTAFKAKIASFAYNPAADERQTKVKLRQVFDIFGDRFPSEQVREALKACKNDLDDAIIWLENRDSIRVVEKPVVEKPVSRRLVSKGALKGRSRNSSPLSRDASPAFTPTPPRRAKRCLVQGLRQRDSPSSQQIVVDDPATPSSDGPLVIDLVENDKDEYQAEPSPEPTQEGNDRVLDCINNSTLKELAAMTGIMEDRLDALVQRRPFEDLRQARRVSESKRPGARKSARICLGDSVVDAVEVFMNAVAAIDDVVAKCEVKAQTIKSVMDGWDVDSFGHDKRSMRTTPDRDMPPTPTSFSSSRLTRPPIAQQPKAMDGHCEMKPFQLFGLNWMSLLYNFNVGCILADEMGLGKTCQVISFISNLVEDYGAKRGGKRPWPNLIVVPPSTYNNWLIEFERFAPGLFVIGYRGSQAERAEIAYEIEQRRGAYHAVLATYSQINSEADVEAMQSFGLNCAIFDEGHKMKNPETKTYQDLKRIPSSWKMLLTGTPVQNNLLEMTSLLNFINPHLFAGCMEHIRYIFSQKVTVRDVSNGAFLYNERVKRARTILEPFILQRRKDQVLSDMPAKVCTIVRCEMSATQKAVYDEYEAKFRLAPSQRAGATRGRQNDQNNLWMQLQKAALHPLLFRRHFSDETAEAMGRLLMDRVPQTELHQPDLKHLIQELKNASDFELHLWCRDYARLLKQFDIPSSAELDSGKVGKLLELIGRYERNGDRVLVFSKFSRVIELLQEVLALRGIGHLVLMGNTSVSERQALIDEFNEDAAIPVFLLTTGAGGTGINLTAANKVIIFDQSDNPQDDIQAENRAHRLGQRREVEVVRLLSSQTIEELIYKACQKKIELANKVTGAVEYGGEAEENLEKEVRRMMEKQEEMTPP
ncbi:hypothetical protein DCS_07973 [Drechmeria coniospora]|uniref:SNF2-related protein n=1 Tax=Drechmeria coniospora TaxID=98403 RepID=A0A151GFY9_DRECN|nr:hypothetical protein DCS_07973 [Drechmeria coniospora]KYK56008.1 hypothetical protein DCS_07973 [Drechmeria coniospora]